MDLKTALEITLHTNPEIAESAANRRAIDFEYEQARRLNNPSIILEGRAGPEWVDSRTTRLLGNDDDVLFGRQASVTMQQNLYDFGRNSSERERQASRVDAAAHRVWERSELVSLDVVQSYFDILRLREVINFADQNVLFHQNKAEEIGRSVSGGVQSEADAQQSRERLSAALVSRNETEEAMEIAESNFVRLVGKGIGRASLPPSIAAAMPGSLGDALRQARTSNPTLHIARGDLSTARAEYRASKADNKPSLSLEVAGRAGEDIGGFRDTTNDVRAQLVFRHEFRGGIKSSAIQEHLNRVDETRQRLLRLERSVDGLVREAWATHERTSQRKLELKKQVDEGTKLLDSYEREFDANRRTLLDILDAQSSLFQAKTSLTTAEHADLYAQYRLLASTGRLLEVMDLDPRREAKANLSDFEGVEDTPDADAEKRRYPKHYDKSMGESMPWAPTVAKVGQLTEADYASIKLTPVERQWVDKPGDEPKPARTAVIEVETPATTEVTAVVEAKPEPVVAAPIIVAEAAPVQPEPVAAPILAETAAPVVETVMGAEQYVPKVYGNYTPSQGQVVVEAAPVVAPVEDIFIEAPAVLEADLAPEFANTTVEVPLEPIMGRSEIAPSQATAVNADANDQELPIGVPIKNVDEAEFKVIKTRPDSKVYWGMGAVLHDNTLYLLK
jgi:adhesin transport system outer membrane protein